MMGSNKEATAPFVLLSFCSFEAKRSHLLDKSEVTWCRRQQGILREVEPRSLIEVDRIQIFLVENAHEIAGGLLPLLEVCGRAYSFSFSDGIAHRVFDAKKHFCSVCSRIALRVAMRGRRPWNVCTRIAHRDLMRRSVSVPRLRLACGRARRSNRAPAHVTFRLHG